MDFNPQNDKQAEDRAHRIGQTKQVVIYKLVTEHSVEYKICEKSVIKLKLDQLIIQSGGMTKGTTALDKNEMKKIIEFGLSEIVQMEGMSRPENIDALISSSYSTYQQDIGFKIKKIEEEFKVNQNLE